MRRAFRVPAEGFAAGSSMHTLCTTHAQRVCVACVRILSVRIERPPLVVGRPFARLAGPCAPRRGRLGLREMRAWCSGSALAFQADDLSFTPYGRLAICIFLLDNVLRGCVVWLGVACSYLQKSDKMPKLTETFARKTPHPAEGTEKHWDTEVRGLVLFVGKRSKTWYFQKDVGGQTGRVLIGRYPVISAKSARQSGMALTLDMARGFGKSVQSAAPTLTVALEAYLAAQNYALRCTSPGCASSLQAPERLAEAAAQPRSPKQWSFSVIGKWRKFRLVPTIRCGISLSLESRATDVRLAPCPTVAIEWYEEEASGQLIEDFSAWATSVDALENPIHAVSTVHPFYWLSKRRLGSGLHLV